MPTKSLHIRLRVKTKEYNRLQSQFSLPIVTDLQVIVDKMFLSMGIYLEKSVIEVLHLPCIQLLSVSQSPLFKGTELHTTRKLLFGYFIINNLPRKRDSSTSSMA